MSRDPRIRLEDIAEACARVTGYLVGVDCLCRASVQATEAARSQELKSERE